LLLALAYFFDDQGVIAAAAPAVFVHEMGHLLPLYLCGNPLRRVRVGLFGVEMDYAGVLRGWRAVLCIGGGPMAGLAYAAACRSGGRFWALSGALSLYLTGFNLLPILPLDGGRLSAVLGGETLAEYLSEILALVLLALGAVVAIRFHAFRLLLIGTWLTVCNFRRYPA